MSSEAASMLARLGIDVLAMLLLVGWLYRRSHSAPAMPLVFAALNVGLFAALSAISAGSFKAGIGFGLFGLLSLVRLRSTAFTLKDVAYTFIALVLGLVTGLQERQIWMVAALSALLLLVVAVTDDSRSRPDTQTMTLTLDHLVFDPEVARAELAQRLTARVVNVVIDDIDLLRETTKVSARYEVPEASSEWPTTVDRDHAEVTA
jgi:uncharacterized protein DUF4956